MFSTLNPEQRDAVKTLQGPLLVLAGAGTGKTKVITSRIAYMLSQNINPEKIVAVSFTNKAAQEMRERLKGMISNDELASKVLFSTFHAFGMHCLRKYVGKYLTGKSFFSFGIAGPNDARGVLRESLIELNALEAVSLGQAAQWIGECKENLLEGDEQHELFFRRPILKHLLKDYQKRLLLYQLVDFDDLIYLPTILLKKHPEALVRVQEDVEYLMIDEYQDTSPAQFELSCMIGDKHKNICVVGDDDQSIYAWRGAKPESIQDFLRQYPTAKKVTLEQNYRCSPNILSMANTVISKNEGRIGKVLWSQQPNPFPLHLHVSRSERDESLYVAESILKYKNANRPFEHFSVLVRSSSQVEAIEQAFLEKRIPYQVHAGTKMTDRKDIKDLLSFLRMAANPCDLQALFRVINLPARGVGLVTLEKMRNAFEKISKQNPEEPLKELLAQFATEHNGVKSFFNLWEPILEDFKKVTSTAACAQLLRRCFKGMELEKEVLSSSVSEAQRQVRLDIIARVLDAIENAQIPNFELDAVARQFALDDREINQKDKTQQGVQIMTIHAAKGLEFPVVFLIGVEDGILPHEKSLDTDSGEEEERRLFYVAITRAKERLMVSYCEKRKISQKNNATRCCLPSRFLKDVPETMLRAEYTTEEAETTRKSDATRRLLDLLK